MMPAAAEPRHLPIWEGKIVDEKYLKMQCVLTIDGFFSLVVNDVCMSHTEAQT